MAILAMGIGAASGAQTASAQAVSVQVNGNPVAFGIARPMMVNGRMMVPMRDIFQALRATVQYDAASRVVRADRGVNRVEMTLGQSAATLNGKRMTLEQPAMLMRGSTYVPLRFVGESLGSVVSWEKSRNAIVITDSGSRMAGGGAIGGSPMGLPGAGGGVGGGLQGTQRGKDLSPIKVNANFAAPINGATVSELPRIRGRAVAQGNGTINRVGVQLLRSKGENGYDFWTPGVGWRLIEFTMPANYDADSGEWELSTGLPTVQQLPPGNYVMNAVVYDQDNRPSYAALGELKVAR